MHSVIDVGCCGEKYLSAIYNIWVPVRRGQGQLLIVLRRSRVVRHQTLTVRIPPAAAVYQRQLSVPPIRGRLMSTSESWEVNGHTTRCNSPVSAVSRLRLMMAT